jgi:mycothiol synthase
MLPGVLDLPPRLSSRPLTPADAGAVTALMASCELHDDGTVEIAVEDIVADWARPSTDLAAHTVGVFEGQRLVAYAEVSLARRAEAYVAPDQRGRGIGTALLQWTRATARAGGGTLVGQTVSDRNTGAIALLTAHGYRPLWTSWILKIDLVEQPPEPVLPAGYVLRRFVPGRDEQAAYRVIEDAFAEWPDRTGTTYEDWAAGAIGRERFRPDDLALVEHGGAVVAACLVLRYGGEGAWVHQLAVERGHRGRGLARALLFDAFRAAWRHGDRSSGLSTDSRTGALGLYEHVGMRVERSYTHLAGRV